MIAARNKIYQTLLIIFLGAGHLFSQGFSLSTIAGSGTGFSGDGSPATSASLFNPMAVFADSRGRFFIADWYNARVRMVDTNGIITTIAGNGIFGYNGDGIQATAAELKGSMGICTDKAGNIYISDIGNSRIRKINTYGIISTIAGNGAYGFSRDGGSATAAELSAPGGICTDFAGNIFVADIFNNRVRKIDTSGNITTIAGNGTRGFSGDGVPAAATSLYYPVALAADRSGNLYIADADNSRIRKVDALGMISTVAGTGIFGSSGDGGNATAAELANPSGVWADNNGNVFIADGLENRIRMVDSSGIITCIAGTGNAGTTLTSGDAAMGLLDNPVGITGDYKGNIYFANAFNQLVQKLTPLPIIHPSNFSVTVYPNPGSGSFNFQIENFSGKLNVMIYDILGQQVSAFALTQPLTIINLQKESSGMYFYRITDIKNSPIDNGKLMLIKN